MKWNMDILGISASTLCAIHCAVMPLFFSSFPLFGINIINNSLFEIGMIALAFIIGIYALLHSYKKHHQKSLPLLIFSVGFVFLVLKQIFHQYEYVLLLPGVVCIVAAHSYNLWLSRKHKNCHLAH
jgi:tetrahydromethanopterin S-methyltransferase subunit C